MLPLLLLLLAMLLLIGAAIYGMRPRAETRVAPWPRWIWLALGLAALGMLVAIPVLALRFSSGDRARTSTNGVLLTAGEVRARELFTSTCKNCHTLADANAISTIGPNLDVLKPSRATVIDAVTNGRARGNGQMPKGLTDAQGARDVAEYLADVAGR